MKVIAFVLLFVFSNVSSNAQQYNPMLTNTNKWLVIGWFESCRTDSLWISGDTIFNNKVYKKLMGNALSAWPTYPKLNSLLREDTTARKVFALRVGSSDIDTTERILYDFSLQVGDSILLYNNHIFSSYHPLPDTFGWYVVDSITQYNALIGQRNLFHLSRKYYSGFPISAFNYTTWIESVGEVDVKAIGNYTLNYYQGSIGGSTVSCFYQDGVKVVSNYVHGIDTCYCNSTIGLKEVGYLSHVEIYPNPFDDVINIDFSQHYDYDQATIEVFKSVGSSVYSQRVTNNMRLLLSNLSSGVYFLRVKNKEGVTIKKLIKN